MTAPIPVPNSPDPTVDVVVLGAGISGLVSASVLLDEGAESVLVIDEYQQAGGNHLDVAIGDFTYDVGSFIFQDDSPLLVHFPELLPEYEVIHPTWARLNPQGVVTHYPYSVRDDIVAAGVVEIARIVGSAVRSRISRDEVVTAGDFARHWLGPRFLRRSGLENYMERFCGAPIELIDLAFAESRMGWIKERTQRKALARALRASLPGGPSAEPTATNRQLARPRAGFGALYAPLVAGLERRGAGFAFGEQLRAIRRTGDAFEVETASGVVIADRLISTIPVSLAAELCKLSCDPLPTVTLISLFYSFDGDRGFTESILYNFSFEARWKRLTMYSDFYDIVMDRSYFTVEVVAAQSGTTIEQAAEEFRRHTAANGLFAGDLRLEGSHVLTNAYPLYTRGSAQNAARTVAALRGFGVESFGRQGGFRYQPTARVSTLEAEVALRGAGTQ